MRMETDWGRVADITTDFVANACVAGRVLLSDTDGAA